MSPISESPSRSKVGEFADLDKMKKLIKIKDWKIKVKPRHHKFIEYFIAGGLEAVVEKFKYTENDTLRILKRIENQLAS